MRATSQDEALIEKGRTERSQMLANMFKEFAQASACRCGNHRHEQRNPLCPKGVWEMAAKTAVLLTAG